MPAEMMTAERGLKRIRQIAAEELAAIHARDETALCRLTELMQPAVEDLCKASVPPHPEVAEVLAEVRQAHEQAERYLEEQMKIVRSMLQQYTTARSTLRAYGNRTPIVQFDKAW